MKNLTIVSVLLVLFTITGCGNKEKELQTKIDANIKLYKETKETSSKMNLVKEIVKQIDSLTKTYPNNEKNPTYLYTGAELCFDILDIDKSNEFLIAIYEKYPKYEKIADVTLKIAIVYDTKGDAENAKKYYTDFISKYPTHKDIPIAKDALSLVGKDINEIVKQFENKNEADSIAKK